MRPSLNPRTLKIAAVTALFLIGIVTIPQTTNAAGSPMASVFEYGQTAMAWLFGSQATQENSLDSDDKKRAVRPASPYLPGEEPSQDQKIVAETVPGLAPACAPDGNPAIPVVSGGSIQAAINAASFTGSTIQVAAGTYTEQLTINKCVFIEGAGAGQTIIKSPPTLSPTNIPGVSNVASIVEVRSNSFVTMSGVTIEGYLSFANTNEYGVFVAESGTFKLSDSAISKMRQSGGISGVQNGRAVYVGRANGNQIGSIDFTNVDIDDFNKSGIFVDHVGSHARLDAVTITGAGAIPAIAQNGLTVINGATAEVLNSTISNNNFSLPSSSSAGILAIGDRGLSVTGSTFTGNNYGIRRQLPTTLWATTIVSNRIEDNDGAGILLEYAANTPAVTHNAHFNYIVGNGVGMYNDSGVNVNAENNFWGCNEGPSNAGCDTVVDDSTGVTGFDPWLTLTIGDASPTTVAEGTPSTVPGASLRVNSDGQDTFTMVIPVGQSVPDGIDVSYTADYGTISTNAGTFTDGLAAPAPITFTGAVGNSGDQNGGVNASVSNATATAAITVTDETAPTVTINQKVGQTDPTNVAPIEFTAVFNETVTGFDCGDVVAGALNCSNIIVTDSGDSKTFNIAVTPTASGPVIATIPTSGATDQSGNGNEPSTSLDNQVAYFAGSIELVVDSTLPTPVNCLPNGSPVYPTIQSAVTAAGAGYTIKVCPGTHSVTTNIGISQPGLTIINALPTRPTVNVTHSGSGNGENFTVSASGVRIEGLDIVKPVATSPHNVITVQGTAFTAHNNSFTATIPWTTGDTVSRAFVVSASAMSLAITNNTITDFRQPAYIDGNGSTLMGTVSGNTATRTKGWVLAEAVLNFTGNTFGQTCLICDADIALIPAQNQNDFPLYVPNPAFAAHYAPYLGLSSNNNNAFVRVRVPNDPQASGRAQSFVDDDAVAGGDGRAGSPYQTIQQAIFNPASLTTITGTLPGGTVYVASGTYEEDVAVSRALTVIGAAPSNTTIEGQIGGDNATVRIGASNVSISGFKITRFGNTVSQWFNPGLNTAGVAIQGQTVANASIHNNYFVGNRTAIDINDSSQHTIYQNRISENRTGIFVRNRTDNITVTENEITNNFTIGILFGDESGGDNVPIQRALYSTVSNNNISDNWYAGVVDRQAIPAPGTTNLKNVQGNWFGSPSPTVVIVNSAEVGYGTAGQNHLIPVSIGGVSTGGGTAESPGGQPDIAGIASANILYKQVLPNGTDSNTGLGFSGVPIVTASSDEPNTWYSLDETLAPHVGSGSAGFVSGPGGQPLGSGSGKIVVDGTGRWNLSTKNYQGLRLDDITSLSYWTYQEAGTPGLVPVLQFDVDNDLEDSNNDYQGRLVFIPSTPVATSLGPGGVGFWQKWDVKNGNLYGSPGSGTRPLNEDCPPPTGCDIPTILAAHPRTGIRLSNTNVVSDGRIHFRMGGDWPGGSTAYVDAFEIGVGGTVTVHDFEADLEKPTADLTYLGTVEPTNGTLNFKVVFSESVSAPLAGLIHTSHGTIDNIQGSGNTYTFSVDTSAVPLQSTTKPTADYTGDVTVQVLEDASFDASGNGNIASNIETVDFDNDGPGVTINRASSQSDPTTASPIVFDVVFTEPVTGFGEGSVDLSTSTASGPLAASVSGSGTTWTVSVTGMSSNGEVIASILAGAAIDNAGNTSSASTSTDNSVNYFTGVTTLVVDDDGQASATDCGASDAAFTTIQSAINATVAGSTIKVCPGLYAENLVVDKQLTLTGPQAGIDTNTRAGSDPLIEAIVVPSTSGPLGGASPAIIDLSADDVVINGFTIDGNNPALTSGVLFNSVDVDAYYGIVGTGSLNPDATISYNIVQNIGEFGIFIWSNQGGVKTQSLISNNKIDNIIGAFGQGIRTSDDAWSSITDNVVTRVRSGIVIENFSSRSSSGHPASVVEGNDVTSFGIGIRPNLHYSYSGPGFTISDNTIKSYAQTVFPSGVSAPVPESGYRGFRIESIQGSVPLTIQNNIISIDRAALTGYSRVDGIWLTNTSTVSPNITISGNTISGALRGISHTVPATPTVTCNTIYNNEVGIYVGHGVQFGGTTESYANNGITASGNSLVGNSLFAVQVDQTFGLPSGNGNTNVGPATADGNYWGSTDGAGPVGTGLGDKVSTNVTFSSPLNAPGCAPAVTYPTATIDKASGQNDPTDTAPINFTVTFSENVAGLTDSDIRLGGTAASTVTNITGGPLVWNVEVTPTSDGTVTADVYAGAGASIATGFPSVAAVPIDNTVVYDATEPTLSVTKINDGVEDPNAPAVFEVTMSDSHAFEVTVNYQTSGGSLPGQATDGVDYSSTTGTLTFAADTTTLTQTISVPVTNDNEVEPVETFTMTLSDPTNASITTTSADATITSEDTCSNFTAGPSPQNFTHTGGTSSISVTVNPGCSWTATSSDPWITLTGATSGNGAFPSAEPVAFTVAANGYGQRNGTINVTQGSTTIPIVINQAQSPINVDIADGITESNSSTVIVPVNILTDTSTRNILSFEFSVNFDSNVLTPVGIDTAGTMSAAFTTNSAQNPGNISVSGTNSAPLSGTGTLINLVFTVNGNVPACTTLEFAPSGLIPAFKFNTGDPLDITSDGNFCVVNGDVSGRVVYGNAQPTAAPAVVPVSGVQLDASGAPSVSGTTDGAGNYLLTGFGNGAYTIAPTKSLDRRNAILSIDASLIQQHRLGLLPIPLTARQLKSADVDGNGIVQSFDAALIQQFRLGIAPVSPIINNTGNWIFDPVSRFYSVVDSDKVNQDYDAYLLGDVDGSWSAAPVPTVGFDGISAEKTTVPGPVSVGGTQPVSLTIPNSVVLSNATEIQVEIKIGDVTGLNVTAYDLDIEFDPNVIVPASTSDFHVKAGTLSAPLTVGTNRIASNMIAVSAFGSTAMTGSGNLLILRFHKVGGSGSTSPLNFIFSILNGGSPSHTPTNGSVSIVDPTAAEASVAGVVLGTDQRAVSGAFVSVSDGGGVVKTVRTNTFGRFTVSGLPVGRTYFLTVRDKRYEFDPVTLNLSDNVSGLSIVAR